MKVLAAGVVIDGAIYSVDKVYTYLISEDLKGAVLPGKRVTVPFGRGNRKKQGLVVELTEREDTAGLKSIESVIDEKPLLTEELLGIVKHLKNTTFCTWFDAVRTVLPYGICVKIVETYRLVEDADRSTLSAEQKMLVGLLSRARDAVSRKKLYADSGLTDDCGVIEALVKKGIITRDDLAIRNTGDATSKMVRLTDAADTADTSALTQKQKQALSVLGDAGCCSVKELCYFSGVGLTVINGLCKKGFAELFEQTYYRVPKSNEIKPTESPKLSKAQKEVYGKLEQKLLSDTAEAALLYGVTGSGKTQVFMKLCERAVGLGKGVIIMVPEISLTPQTVAKFRSLFGDSVALFHSAMSQGQRMDEWRRVNEGKATIAVGTRSAVFAPVKNLGLIVMDEEQEHTYKSEMSPRYHARDIAKFRAGSNGALFLMASATPSIETYHAAVNGRYTLCELDSRYGNAILPLVQTVDMRSAAQRGAGSIGSELAERIEEVLGLGKQAILLLNRRGRNTVVSCASCGEIVKCESCSIPLTYHSANNRLMCHYCGASIDYINKCPKCGSEHIKYLGVGTQKIEEELAELFPEARILRMDSDSTMTKDSYEKGLVAFSRGEYDIMLGTQMVAKGLDFPNVTLVGVISADQSMYSTDFRGVERTFSLLTQVVGRSGRGDTPGTALIQTMFPDNEIIHLAAEQNYKKFYEQEILTRKLMIYPPFCDIAQIVVSGPERDNAEQRAADVLQKLKSFGTGDYKDVKMIVLGPSPAAIPKMNGKYRYRLILKFKNNSRSREMLTALLDEFSTYSRREATVSVDINPENLI